MVEMYRAGRLDEARAIYDRVVQPLVTTIFAAPVRDYRVRLKEAIAELGVIDSTAVRAPLLGLSDGERRKVREAVRGAGLRVGALRAGSG